jgi:ribosomal silencing factor RsfS
MDDLTIEEQMKMIKKLLNTFLKSKFPEIYDIELEDKGYFLEIHILVDGTDEEQEMEIEEAVENALKYTGTKIKYGITFHVEIWDWGEDEK